MILRIIEHPILGKSKYKKKVKIYFNGKRLEAYEGEMIAAALIANGIKVFRYTKRENKPRGVFCDIGICTDCVMVVNKVPNITTCITPVRDGLRIETQKERGDWRSQ